MGAIDELQPTWRPPLDKSHLAMERFREFINSRARINLHERLPIDQCPEFYKGSRLNYAENALAQGRSGTAIVSLSEAGAGETQTMSWEDLNTLVGRASNALRACGVGKGDVVAFIGANKPSAVIVFLAAASVGAIFTSLAPDMGEKGIVDRLMQVRARLLFADDAYQYKGKLYPCEEKLRKVIHHLQKEAGLELGIIMPNTPGTQTDSGKLSKICISWDKFLARGANSSLVFEQLPFNHPMLILFSSGSTGAPKGMVHCHGGILINLKKEHVLHNNMSSSDIYYHYSNIGWTMWNIFLGGMLAGAKLVLYDGSPFYPSPQEHLHSIISLGTTVFGGSPRYFAELMKLDVVPRKFADIQNIRLVQSTGAVLGESVWLWMAKAFNGAPIMSFSGGTEACGSFLHGTLVHPQYPGEITVKELGIDVDIYDQDGNPCELGQSGDLVIKQPFPNAALGFLSDEDGSRYRSSYFEANPGVWTHGDFTKINPATKGIIMLGRSDGILNPSGVRFGSSEIYSAMGAFDNVIQDSLCVGKLMANQEEHVLLFVQTAPHTNLSAQMQDKIRRHIAETLSPRHVPHYIFAVPNIPYNKNGKKLEVLVKKVLSGGIIQPHIKTTLVDENSLDFFGKYSKVGSTSSSEKAKL